MQPCWENVARPVGIIARPQVGIAQGGTLIALVADHVIAELGGPRVARIFFNGLV
jgi:hypothetical protein